MTGLSDRAAQGAPLGRCPNCETMIPRSDLLISFETDGGWPKMLAECRTCDAGVHPV